MAGTEICTGCGFSRDQFDGVSWLPAPAGSVAIGARAWNIGYYQSGTIADPAYAPGGLASLVMPITNLSECDRSLLVVYTPGWVNIRVGSFGSKINAEFVFMWALAPNVLYGSFLIANSGVDISSPVVGDYRAVLGGPIFTTFGTIPAGKTYNAALTIRMNEFSRGGYTLNISGMKIHAVWLGGMEA